MLRQHIKRVERKCARNCQSFKSTSSSLRLNAFRFCGFEHFDYMVVERCHPVMVLVQVQGVARQRFQDAESNVNNGKPVEGGRA